MNVRLAILQLLTNPQEGSDSFESFPSHCIPYNNAEIRLRISISDSSSQPDLRNYSLLHLSTSLELTRYRINLSTPAMQFSCSSFHDSEVASPSNLTRCFFSLPFQQKEQQQRKKNHFIQGARVEVKQTVNATS